MIFDYWCCLILVSISHLLCTICWMIFNVEKFACVKEFTFNKVLNSFDPTGTTSGERKFSEAITVKFLIWELLKVWNKFYDIWGISKKFWGVH